MPGSLHHLLSPLGSPLGMADAMHLKPNWSICGAIVTPYGTFIVGAIIAGAFIVGAIIAGAIVAGVNLAGSIVTG